jgi:ribonuclease P protein component
VKQSDRRARKTKASSKARELIDEKDLSAEQPPAQKNPWIPRANGDARRPQRAPTAAAQGADTTDGIDSAQTARLERKTKTRKAFGFGPENRLHKSRDFHRIQREGIRVVAGRFVIYGLHATAPSQHRQDGETEAPDVRLGLAISRRVGNAVVRNRIKRRIRECFRTILRPMIAGGTDIVVIAREGAAEVSFDAMRDALARATITLGNRAK